MTSAFGGRKRRVLINPTIPKFQQVKYCVESQNTTFSTRRWCVTRRASGRKMRHKIQKEDLIGAVSDRMNSTVFAREHGLRLGTVTDAERRLGVSLPRGNSERTLRERVGDMRPLDAVEYLLDLVESFSPALEDVWSLSVPGCRFTKYEGLLFLHLFRAAPRIETRARIMDALYAGRCGDEPDEKVVDVFICKLRKKLKDTGLRIESVWGVGYRLYVPPEFKAPWEKGRTHD